MSATIKLSPARRTVLKLNGNGKASAVVAEVSATFAQYAAQTPAGKDYIVRDFSLAEWGRKELNVAEHEMPGLISVRKKYENQTAQRRAHHRFVAHDHSDRRAH